MLQLSTTLRDAILAGGSINSELTGGFIYIFASTAGVPPASADAVLDMVGTHTLLGKISANAGGGTGVTFTTPATGGVLTKTAAETWSTGTLASFVGAQSASTTLNAVFYRHCVGADTGETADSGSTPRIQGACGTTMVSEMIMITTALTVGLAGPVLTAYQIEAPNA